MWDWHSANECRTITGCDAR
ncbi:hypothetical protein [Arsenophonus endosymbiont of Aleurodicus floccissimus]|nr:hypothetical protein [Arsenophonus endosymbiont of Aleurodicus floccissimus]